MSNAERFLGNDLPRPTPAEHACDATEICCLCDDPIGDSHSVMHRFETDPAGNDYCAHAKCAHEYVIATRAFRGAMEPRYPQY
jgi:hypothetical protein